MSARSYGLRGPTAELYDELVARGWEERGRTGSGHLRLRYLPNGGTLIVSVSPSDKRGWLNLRSAARRIEAQGPKPRFDVV